MDTLFGMNRAQFHQLVTHVSLYREDASAPYKQLAEEVLEAAGHRPSSFTFWHVPNMDTYLGKAVPVDVHGKYVLLDEDHALAKARSYGMLKYALMTSSVRAKEGGRRRYDFITLNMSLAAGTAAGFGFLNYGRYRWKWMMRRPLGCILGSFGVCLATVVLARAVIKGLGVGLVVAERGHGKALRALRCVDCLTDVSEYTLEQIEELKAQKIPTQPGTPPPPPEYVKKFEQNVQLQVDLLTRDVGEVGRLKKIAKSAMCSFHQELRADPDGYRPLSGLVVLAADRQRARQRLQSSASEGQVKEM
jgi:hypothetical protein